MNDWGHDFDFQIVFISGFDGKLEIVVVFLGAQGFY